MAAPRVCVVAHSEVMHQSTVLGSVRGNAAESCYGVGPGLLPTLPDPPKKGCGRVDGEMTSTTAMGPVSVSLRMTARVGLGDFFFLFLMSRSSGVGSRSNPTTRALRPRVFCACAGVETPASLRFVLSLRSRRAWSLRDFVLFLLMLSPR